MYVGEPVGNSSSKFVDNSENVQTRDGPGIEGEEIGLSIRTKKQCVTFALL